MKPNGRPPLYPSPVGHRFGRLRCVEKTIVKRNSSYLYRCVCDCGNEKLLPPASLRNGVTASCGCLRREVASATMTTHGQTSGKSTPVYRTWIYIKERCLNPNNSGYYKYGGIGITICNEWANSFEKFREYMGERPSNLHSIDRIDNYKGYEPGNVRWATTTEQAYNRRNTVRINGELVYEYANRMGLTRSAVYSRIRRANARSVKP